MDVGGIFEDVGKEHRTWFDLFEPWDIEERPEWQIEEAATYGVLLDKGPKSFQTGVLMSEDFITAAHAANQTGKSITSQVQAIMYCTGVIPLALRTPKGEVTDILREHEDPEATAFNIERFGRFDRETGDHIDNDVEAIQDGTWHCGYVVGAGIYPKRKMPRGACQVWVCCPKAIRDNTWIPQFKKRWPKRLLRDDDRVKDGYEAGRSRFHSNNGSVLSFLSYDSGYVAPEGIKAHNIILDEEPPDQRFWGACLTHAKHINIQFTPIHGIGWTKREIIDMKERKDSDALSISVFHCTAYDSPYLDNQTIKTQMASAPEWQIKPKFFGHFAPQTAQTPFFDRKKIGKWLKSWYPRHEFVRLSCEGPWETPSECVNISITGEEIEQMTEEKARLSGDLWQVYERPEPKHTYYAGCDVANGHEDPNEGIDSDWSVCLIRRVKMENETYDPIVAVIETRDRPIPFARQVVMGCCWYNNCLVAPEDNGEAGGILMSQLIPTYGGAYPHILKMTVISGRTRKAQERRGWNNRGPKSRREAFEALQEFVTGFDWFDDPRLPNYNLILQFANCIIGRNGRPDHPKRGHDDVLISFGITEWVRIYCHDQIRNNYSGFGTGAKRRKGARDFSYNPDEQESRPVLGSRRGLDARGKSMVRKR